MCLEDAARDWEKEARKMGELQLIRGREQQFQLVMIREESLKKDMEIIMLNFQAKEQKLLLDIQREKQNNEQIREAGFRDEEKQQKLVVFCQRIECLEQSVRDCKQKSEDWERKAGDKLKLICELQGKKENICQFMHSNEEKCDFWKQEAPEECKEVIQDVDMKPPQGDPVTLQEVMMEERDDDHRDIGGVVENHKGVSKSFSKKKLKKLVVKKSEQYHQCEECVKKFLYKHDLKRHQATVHMEVKSHECLHCNKKFGYKWVLKTHINVVHKREKPYQCPVCNKNFGRKDRQKRHLATVHQGVKPFRCIEPECSIGYGCETQLMDHMRAKHGHPRLVCDTEGCSYSFTSKSGVDKHRKNTLCGIHSIC